jgi:predicted heme/steroid binding protein
MACALATACRHIRHHHPHRCQRGCRPSRRSAEQKFTRANVSAMDGTRGKPMWVTYRDGVYDVTHFRADHPGAHFIDAAAGGQWTPMSLPPSTPHARLQLSATILTSLNICCAYASEKGDAQSVPSLLSMLTPKCKIVVDQTTRLPCVSHSDQHQSTRRCCARPCGQFLAGVGRSPRVS